MALAKEISPGMCIKYNNEIYKLKRKEVVAVGTHSHTKLKFFLKPFFGAGSEKAVIFAHEDKVDTLEILKKRGQILSISGNKAQIMDSVSYETFDAEVQEGVKELKEGGEAIFVQIEGNVFIVDAK